MILTIIWILFSVLTFYLVSYNFLYDFDDELESFSIFYRMFNKDDIETDLISSTKYIKWALSLGLGTCYGLLGPVGFLMIVLIKIDGLKLSENKTLNIIKLKMN